MWDLDHKESWALKNWCFWTVVLEKILASPLVCKEIQPVHPKGSRSWIFIGRTDVEAETPILRPPDIKNWHIGKYPDAGQDCRLQEKGATEDEIVGWHHRLDGCDFEQAPDLVMGREVWHAPVVGVTKNGTRLSKWIELNLGLLVSEEAKYIYCNLNKNDLCWYIQWLSNKTSDQTLVITVSWEVSWGLKL